MSHPVATARTWTRWPVRHPALQFAWCLCGAGVGIALTLWITDLPSSPFLLASLGGSTVFLFGLTRAPAAQPRAVLGGHLGGALIGIACYQFLGDALWVYVVAQMLGLGYMLAARVVHPPAGANPILMVYAHAQWSALLNPVLLGVLCLMAVAFAWTRVFPGMVRYPVAPLEPSPPQVLWGVAPEQIAISPPQPTSLIVERKTP